MCELYKLFSKYCNFSEINIIIIALCENSFTILKNTIMKMKSIKLFAVIALIAFSAISSFGQAPAKTTKDDGKKAMKVDKKKVPKEVNDVFFMDYPGMTGYDWYGYPEYNYGDYWFDDWYDYGLYSYVNDPEYYVVEFNKDNTPVKAVYSKSGNKVAAHKMLTSDLPKAVTDAINKGVYKTWKLGKDKEEIFKDSDKDQLKVYKVNIEKGKEKHTLFFQTDGKLLKDKKVS